MRKTSKFAATLWVALCAPVAQAATASFDVSNLRYELHDLDVNDNVTPGLQMYSTSYFSGLYLRDGPKYHGLEQAIYGPGDLNGSWGSASSRTSNAGGALSGSLVNENRSLGAVAIYHQYFKLTPNTAVTFCADASVNSQGVFTQVGAPGSTWGSAELELQLSTASHDVVSYAIDQVATYLPSHPLAVSARSGNVEVYGALDLDGRAYSFLTPVPEPFSYAMLGAGLLALAVRRKFSGA